MKVLHVIAGLQKSAGTSVFCGEICSHLALLGVKCAICVQKLSDDTYQSSQSVAIFQANGDQFDELLFKPDIVHIHALWTPFLHQAVRWARKNGLPYLISPHGMLTPWALGQNRFKKMLALALYQYSDLRRAALIHATADSEVNDLRRLGLKNEVCVVPLGVNISNEDVAMRGNQVKTMLFVSRVQRKKGLLNLVRAWKILVDEFKSSGGRSAEKINYVHPLGWRVLIAGPDQEDHAHEVMALVKELDIASDFELLGPVYDAQKDALYVAADCFVLPTYSENFGSVVIEALAHGCPVITTKGAPWSELLGAKACLAEWQNSSVAEWLNNQNVAREESSTYPSKLATPANPAIAANGRSGWWIDIGVEPLVVALREAMMLSDVERHQMGMNGRQLVMEKYAWTGIAKQMVLGYEQAFAKKT